MQLHGRGSLLNWLSCFLRLSALFRIKVFGKFIIASMVHTILLSHRCDKNAWTLGKTHTLPNFFFHILFLSCQLPLHDCSTNAGTCWQRISPADIRPTASILISGQFHLSPQLHSVVRDESQRLNRPTRLSLAQLPYQKKVIWSNSNK